MSSSRQVGTRCSSERRKRNEDVFCRNLDQHVLNCDQTTSSETVNCASSSEIQNSPTFAACKPLGMEAPATGTGAGPPITHAMIRSPFVQALGL
eukprot:2440661-Amphidinium_carterae.2